MKVAACGCCGDVGCDAACPGCRRWQRGLGEPQPRPVHNPYWEDHGGHGLAAELNELREALEMSESVSPEQVAAEAVAQLRLLRADLRRVLRSGR